MRRLAKVEDERYDGSWSKPDAVEALEVPDDLGVALRRVPNGLQNFEAFPRSAKRAILEWGRLIDPQHAAAAHHGLFVPPKLLGELARIEVEIRFANEIVS